MTKPNSQDVPIEAGGKKYRLRFSLRALFFLRDKWKIDDMEGLNERLNSIGPFELPIVLQAALISHHPDITTEEALSIADELNVNGLEQAVALALSGGVPDPDPQQG